MPELTLPELSPCAKHIQRASGSFNLKKLTGTLIPQGLPDRLQFHLFQLEDSEEFKNYNVQIRVSSRDKTGTVIKIDYLNPMIASHSYELSIDEEQILISASSEASIYYGLQTLKQITQQHKNHTLPCLKIQDEPSIMQRGYMLDISRSKVPKLEEIFELIHNMAALRLNQLQLYTEHTYEFENHKQVWKSSSPLSASDILKIQMECKKYFIDLVPNLNSFGHFERWLKHKDYQHLAISPNGFKDPWGKHRKVGSTLMPDQQSLDFLSALWSEYLPHFDSAFFNIGGDETFELGQGRSESLCKEQGKGKVYINFLKQLNEQVENHHKRAMFWGDIVLNHPETIPEIPPTAVAIDWGYEADHPFKESCIRFRDTGLCYYVAPGTSSWNTLLGRWDNCLENLLNAAKHGVDNGAEGYLITDWGDNGHLQYPFVSWPGIIYGACVSWNPENIQQKAIQKLIQKIFIKNKEENIWAPLIIQAAQLDRSVKRKYMNANPFHHWLFNANIESTFKDITKSDVQKARQKWEQLFKKVKAMHTTYPNHTIGKELINALHFVSVAISRAEEKVLEKKISYAQKKLFAKSIKEHTNLWLTRNRRGGLNEGLAFLKKALKELEKN